MGLWVWYCFWSMAVSAVFAVNKSRQCQPLLQDVWLVHISLLESWILLTHLTVNSNHLETYWTSVLWFMIALTVSWPHDSTAFPFLLSLISYSPPLLFFDLRAGDTNTLLLMSATQQLFILSSFTVLRLWVPFMVKRSLFIKRRSFVYGYKEGFRILLLIIKTSIIIYSL